jgi:ABC-type transporter Mla maintaining outer membrane lipid asymmetry ATPase subunit MlaF
MGAPPMIHLAGVALEGPQGGWLLEGLDLQVPRGGALLLTGASGRGKTRLLKVIAGVERPAQGEVSLGGRRIWPGQGALALTGHLKVGLAFAQGGLLSNLSLRENLRLPLTFLGLPAREVELRTESALERLGLGAAADLRPHAVSAAARKHGNLARVLALEPDVILLDDPLEGLDAADRSTALEAMRTWWKGPDQTLVIAQETAGPLADWALASRDLQPLATSREAS